MGNGAIGAVSMGFVGRRDCGDGYLREATSRLDGRPIATCSNVVYGGFGYFPHRFDGHGHGHGHGHRRGG
jgi:hypothetical protein